MTVPDIVIVGLGPAGAALATGLAAGGIRVRLVDGGAPRAALEGYSDRTWTLLQSAHLHRTAEVLTGPVARSGVWGTRDVAGFERLADRRVVHACLATDVVASGVELVSARWSPTHTRDALSRGVRLVIDATGRHGRALSGPRLLAIATRMRSSTQHPKTQIGTWSGGWFWIADDGVHSQLQIVAAPRSGPPSDWIGKLIREQPELSEYGKSFASGFVARAAHARLAEAEDPLTRVGDAALAVDPLSGHGVYEALQSALLHVSAVRTALRGGDLTLVRQFLTSRRRETWSRTVSAAASFYRDAGIDSPFWRDCAGRYQALADDAALLEVTSPRIEKRPVLDDGYISERPVVVTPSLPRGAWRVAGVPVVELYDYLKAESVDATELKDVSRQFGHPEAAVQAAVNWLKSSGLTIVREGAST